MYLPRYLRLQPAAAPWYSGLGAEGVRNAAGNGGLCGGRDGRGRNDGAAVAPCGLPRGNHRPSDPDGRLPAGNPSNPVGLRAFLQRNLSGYVAVQQLVIEMRPTYVGFVSHMRWATCHDTPSTSTGGSNGQRYRAARSCAGLGGGGRPWNLNRPAPIARPVVREPSQGSLEPADVDVSPLLQRPDLFTIVEDTRADRGEGNPLQFGVQARNAKQLVDA